MGKTAAVPAPDITSIDWKNRTYVIPADVDSGADLMTGEYPVVDGKYEWDKADGDHGWVSVSEPSFGDLDGDGVAEAVVIIMVNTGGSGIFSDGLIYRAGEPPTLIARLPGGDRGAGGLRTINVVGPGVLAVERNHQADHEGANEWSLVRRETWILKDGVLSEDESKREVVKDPDWPS